MKNIHLRFGRNCIAALFALSILALGSIGCAARTAVSPQHATEAPDPSEVPEVINHTPFPTTLVAAADKSGRYFYSAIVKVTLTPHSNGHWRFDQIQEEITESSILSAACPGAPEKISDLTAFRETAEIFLRPNANRGEKVTVTVGTTQHPVHFLNGCRVYESASDLILTPYIQDGTPLTVKGLNGSATKSFRVPKGLSPFVLIRYVDGQMIFTPTRLDTATLDTAGNRMILSYRTTMWTSPRIRKIEYMAILPEEMRDRSNPREIDRDEAFIDHFARCPAPTRPVEPCSSPDTPQRKVFFGIDK